MYLLHNHKNLSGLRHLPTFRYAEEVCATLVERLKRRYAQFNGAAERELGKINAKKRLRKKHHADGREDTPVVRSNERA